MILKNILITNTLHMKIEQKNCLFKGLFKGFVQRCLVEVNNIGYIF